MARLATTKDARVVIVGGGIAGLAAAVRLLEQGVTHVHVLEAGPILGGRIHSVDFGGGNVEMGAQWLHGKQGNAAFTIASNLKLVYQSSGDDALLIGNIFVDENGAIWDMEKEVQEPWKLVLKAENEEVEHRYKEGESVGDYYDHVLAKWSQNRDQENIERMTFSQAFIIMASFRGSVQQYQFCPGGSEVTAFAENNRFSDLIDYFASKIPPSNIHLNTEAREIDYKQDGEPIKVRALRLSSEETYEADIVITTMSLGCLKDSHKSLFQPPLPRANVRAIEAMGFGTVNKIYLKFTEQWWPSDMEGFAFLNSKTKNDDSKLDQELRYNEDQARDDWTSFILGLYPVQHRPEMLVMWVVGAGAEVMESKTDEQIMRDISKKEVLELLQEKYEKQRILSSRVLQQRFKASYKERMTEPVAIKVSRWGTSPTSRGSYSYQSVHTFHERVGPADLAQPVRERILFAGEATHDCFFSTVHGAIESGWREADRIRKILERKDK